jgi:DNA invertase Pin-like site-specific DNA recombinase
MKAIGYIRVSTEDQKLSPEYQRNQIEEFCKKRGWELEEIIEENGTSGKIPMDERPRGAELCQAINDKTREIDTVVILKLDRAFRNTEDCLHTIKAWARRGVSLHFVDMAGLPVDIIQAMGKFSVTILAAVAELERDMISDRTKKAMLVKRSHGEKTGGAVPYGFSVVIKDANGLIINEAKEFITKNNDKVVRIIKDSNGNVIAGAKKFLVTNQDEQEVINLIKLLKEKGRGPRRIAKILNKEGLKTKTGKDFFYSTVEKIVRQYDRREVEHV